MDLTDRQRKILFAVLVVLLAGAGVILTIGSGSSRHHKGAAQRSGSVPAPSPSVPAFTAPGLTGPPPSGGTYDIYSLLPFTQKDFSTAADVARRFTIAYGTYRYDEQPSTYTGRMQGLVSTDLATQLQRDWSAAGLVEQRNQDKEVSTSTAHLDALRDMQKDQFIFLVTGTQHISKGGSTSDTSQQYAVTVTRSGGGWVVYAFQPADQGDK